VVYWWLNIETAVSIVFGRGNGKLNIINLFLICHLEFLFHGLSSDGLADTLRYMYAPYIGPLIFMQFQCLSLSRAATVSCNYRILQDKLM